MIQYAVVFFVLALIAALFGFSGIVPGAAGTIAKIFYAVFLLLALVLFILHHVNRNRR
jgi:uncharacterized membrane protein YtjA (UPF0391 family)